MPCEEDEIHVGDTGTVLEITLEECGVAVDISAGYNIGVTS